MKKIKLFHCLLFLFSLLINVTAQTNEIPNAGFNNWLAEDNPEVWATGNDIGGIYAPAITRTSTSFEGDYAARGEIMEHPLVPGAPWVPSLWLGFIDNFVAPITHRYEKMTGKYIIQNINEYQTNLQVQVNFLDEDFNGVAYGLSNIVNETGSFIDFEVMMDYSIYNNNNDPVWLQIIIALAPNEDDPAFGIGSYFIIDDLQLTGTASSVEQTNNNIPANFTLEQNYPNPFNPVTNINFSIPEQSSVKLKVYNLQGEQVATLINKELPAGNYNANWNAKGMASGMYIYVLRTKNIVLNKKMILLR